MRKYAIIETWNGEGYSSANRMHSIIEANGEDEVMEITKALAESEMTEDDEFITHENGHGWVTEEEEDSGSYQFFEIKDDTFGFVVATNVNEVSMVNEEEFRDMKKYAISQADLDDYEEGELDSDNVFIGAYEGDYDYQFITI